MTHAYFRHREQALGQQPADVLLTNCRLVNVLSGRIEEKSAIAIAGEEIVGIGPHYQGREVIDCGGDYIYPGLIDAHIHLESSKLTIPECARAMVRHGTTAVITDPHEIANVASIEGVSFQLDTASDNERMSVFFTVPSCVPAIPDPNLETFASYMGPTKLRAFFNNPWFVVLGEMMNMPGAIYGDRKVLAKLADSRDRGLPIDGHAPMLSGRELNTYIYLGIRSDHESTSLAEAQEKIDRGMTIMIREGSTESNLRTLLPLVTGLNSARVVFASDDLDPIDLAERGHIDHILRIAVAEGLHPIRALQMATINVANTFRLNNIGAIYPGAKADLVVAPDLETFTPRSVMRHGRFVWRDGAEVPMGRKVDRFLRSTMNADLPAVEALRVAGSPGATLRVIGAVANQIITEELHVPAVVSDGWVQAQPEADVAKIVVFERHRNSGGFGVAYIKGLGIRRGAIGSSVAHDSHNIVVAGVDDADILRCAQRIRDLCGGQVACAGDAWAELPLPIAGLMSDQPFETVVAQEQALFRFCQEVNGTPLTRALSTLSFMALPVIPTLRVTDKGLIRILPGAYPERVGLWV